MGTKFNLYSEPKEIYKAMITDIKSAKKKILLETYIFGGDAVGKEFIDALTEKAKEGVKVKLLLDAWGTRTKRRFFYKFVKAGGEIKFFREFKYVLEIFGKNHERNHKKLLIIDDKITYVGSANITTMGLAWRELVLRLEGKITLRFKRFFNNTWANKRIFKTNFKKFLKGDFQIVYDVPSESFRLVEEKYRYLINSAKKEICIETPYFIPSLLIRKAIYRAIRRGVKVKLLIPYVSNHWFIVDILRNRYLGNLYKKKVEIYMFKPKNSHAKLIIVDDEFFLLGSSNLDYRSFIYQYEINLLGKDKNIIAALQKFFNEGLKQSVKFNYTAWRKRSSFTKFWELLLKKVERYI